MVVRGSCGCRGRSLLLLLLLLLLVARVLRVCPVHVQRCWCGMAGAIIEAVFRLVLLRLFAMLLVRWWAKRR